MNEEDRELKVTDKRMFTAEGELREEYRHVVEREPGPATREPAAPAAPPPQEPRGEPPPQLAGGSPLLEIPGTPPGMRETSFYDLVAMLAEPVAIYLGDAQLPDGGSAENLEVARLHIDLIDVLREKTAGNLSAQESAVLEDVLYRLRMRYVQKRG